MDTVINENLNIYNVVWFLNKIENIKAKNYLKLKIESILLEKMVIYQSKDESEKNNF